MEGSIINPDLSLLIKYLVTGKRQKAPNFLTFHWSPKGSLVSIGQHFLNTRVVHLPKRTETSLLTEADLITESDQVVRAMRSCNSRFVSSYFPWATIFDILHLFSTWELAFSRALIALLHYF